jgi:hypothetical protein
MGISFLFLLDITATYITAIKYRKAFPNDKNWHEIEINIILKSAWKKWGLQKGTFISAIIIYPIIFSIIYFLKDEFIIGMITGLYFMVLLMHIYNLKILSQHGKNS